MHSSYQLNTVFTDVYLLLLQNYKLAQVATWLTSRYSYGTTPLWNLFSVEREGRGLTAARDHWLTPNRSQTPNLTGSMAERKPMGNKSVYN